MQNRKPPPAVQPPSGSAVPGRLHPYLSLAIDLWIFAALVTFLVVRIAGSSTVKQLFSRFTAG